MDWKAAGGISELLGGAKLGEVISEFQSSARQLIQAMADEQGIDLDQVVDDEWADGIGGEGFPSDEDFDQAIPPRPSEPDGELDDYPGSKELWDFANQLEPGERLLISIEIKSPPVTEIERVYYNEVHYQLVFDVHQQWLTYKDVNTPRMDYVHGNGWPAMLSSPKKTWPELTALWDTVKVNRVNFRETLRNGNDTYHPVESLVATAEKVLRSAL